MSDNLKDTIKFIAGIICLIGGIVLSFIALFLPPAGIIDGSVLILIGEVLTFVGAVWHLNDFTKVQMKKIENKAKNVINSKDGE